MPQPVMIAKIAAVLAVFAVLTASVAADEFSVQPDLRPFYLVEKMEETELKTALQQCVYGPFHKTDFSIAHRGTPLQLSEHTSGSFEAAASMGAGILQCDVTLTSDGGLVCCHA